MQHKIYQATARVVRCRNVLISRAVAELTERRAVRSGRTQIGRKSADAEVRHI